MRTYRGGFSTELGFTGMVSQGHTQSRAGGGRRGNVTDFTRASRYRLIRKLGTVNRYAYRRTPTLVTVTYPGVWLQKPAEVRLNVRALLQRLRRKFGKKAVIWRLEYQRRGAPHFHMLVFDPPAIEDLREFVAVAWSEIVGTENPYHPDRGHDVRETHSWRGVVGYVTKYLAKLPDQGAVPAGHQGRFWGIEDRQELRVDPVTYAVSVRQALQLRRWLSRHAGRRIRGHVPAGTMRTLIHSDAIHRLAQFVGVEDHSWPSHHVRPPDELCWRHARLTNHPSPA